MPKHDKHQHTSKFQPRHQQQEQQDDADGTVDAESEKWNPTPEVFQAFLVRDEQLAIQNISMLMQARRAPMTVRELKDQTLHSTDVIERVLASGVATDSIVEAKGKYSLANP